MYNKINQYEPIFALLIALFDKNMGQTYGENRQFRARIARKECGQGFMMYLLSKKNIEFIETWNTNHKIHPPFKEALFQGTRQKWNKKFWNNFYLFWK